MSVSFRIFGGLFIILMSFWITSAVLEAIDYMRTRKTSQLEIAIQSAGLTRSAVITGNVDSVRQDADGRLTLDGWAYDKELGQSVSVLALVDGKLDPIAVTKGARQDVTKALGLSQEQTKDVAFSGRTERTVNCGLNGNLTVVAVNQKKHLSVIGSFLKISGCGKNAIAF